MQTIAILGPEGTFSDKAATEYFKDTTQEMKRIYFPTIDKAFHSVGSTCDYGIIPIENTLDGYVQRTLDLLLEMDINIVKEITVPVKFAFIGNVNNLSEVTRLYVQFKANGQCRNFIESFQDIEIITTDSNTESFLKLESNIRGEAAIVPYHLAETEDNKFLIHNVTDSDNNFTRFIVIRSNNNIKTDVNIKSVKIPFFIMPLEDRPGMLFEILRGFGEKKINLVSIMSRPTKKEMGTYNFYIEISESIDKLDIILNVLKDVQKKYNIKILGIYG